MAFIAGIPTTRLQPCLTWTSGLQGFPVGALCRFRTRRTICVSTRLGARRLCASAGLGPGVPGDDARLPRGSVAGEIPSAAAGTADNLAIAGDAASPRLARLRELRGLLRQLNGMRLQALSDMKDADEPDKDFYKDYLKELGLQIQELRKEAEELSSPPLISVRKLMESRGWCRMDGSPPSPGSIFRGAPVPFPAVRFPRSRVLKAVFLRVIRQLSDDRLVSFLAASSGSGKTQFLADLWCALLQLRTGSRVRAEPFFAIDWEKPKMQQLRQLASSLEVFGLTFNNKSAFTDLEAEACQRGGDYLYLPIYARIIWGEYNNGKVSWAAFLRIMHQLLGIAEVPEGEAPRRWRLDVGAIAAEAEAILDDRRGNPNACGLILVDELSRVCAFDRSRPIPGDTPLLSGALRSKICTLREVGSQQNDVFILLSSLSKLFMEEENNAKTIETSSGRTLVCAGALTRPTREHVRLFFQQLRDVPGIQVSSASLTSSPLELDTLIDGVTYLSGGHPRSMQTILTELSQADMRDKLVWDMLETALQSMSMASSFKQIENTLVSSPLVCAVALLGHPVEGSIAISGPDGAKLAGNGKPQTVDGLVASTTLIDSANESGRFVEPSILPSFLIAAINTHASARSVMTLDYLVRLTVDKTAQLDPDINPVLTSLTGIRKLFVAGTAAKGFEIFHRTWELARSISRSYIVKYLPSIEAGSVVTFTLRERYPASHGVCGAGSLLHMDLDDKHVLLGTRPFTKIADLLALDPCDLVQYVWVPTTFNFPALDAIVFHPRAGAGTSEPLSLDDLYMQAIQCKTKEAVTGDKIVNLRTQFVEPFRRLHKAFGDQTVWAAWQPRVAYIAVLNLPLCAERGDQAEDSMTVLSKKVPDIGWSAHPGEGRSKDVEAGDKVTLQCFLDGEGANTILVARETMDDMYGSLFSNMLRSAIALVGAQVSTA